MTKKVSSLLVFFAFFIGALLQHSEYWEIGIGVSLTSAALIYILLASGESTARYSWLLAAVVVLFFYTIYTSTLVSRSALIAINLMASFLFACAVIDDNKSMPARDHHPIPSAMDLVKIALLVIITAHALLMTAEYLRSPTRVTGLVRDYSQASMAILITFGLLMPQLRKSRFGLIVVAILFLGFFSSFSRSANFLLIIFLGLTLAHCFQRGELGWWLKSTLIIALCFVLVTYYPTLINEATIDRGGLKHFSTLNSRTIYWSAAWEAIQQNPFWGYGLGTYEWSGIKNVLPFVYVPSVHNDYLQIWLDLGVFWLLLMVIIQSRFMIRYQPFDFSLLQKAPSIRINMEERRYIAWSLLLCISLYMVINFIISFLFFQILIATLICEVLRDEN